MPDRLYKVYLVSDDGTVAEKPCTEGETDIAENLLVLAGLRWHWGLLGKLLEISKDAPILEVGTRLLLRAIYSHKELEVTVTKKLPTPADTYGIAKVDAALDQL